ncbi:MAG: roadblock/LC7 domain-containing protein [Chthoniobacter sp.]
MFGKTEPKAVVAVHAAVPAAPSTPMPTIEVAHLSLAAIVGRFPDDLKPLLMSEPGAEATVALPMPTILKQLPTGSVKMSLASLHRQAHGLIKPLPPGDKRSVEVPLAEVFRHVRPESFRRRPDQRLIDVPDNGFNLFGDSTNPYAVSPDDAISEVSLSEAPNVLDLTPEVSSDGPRVLKMDDGLRAFSNGAAAEAAASEDARDTMPRAIAPPSDFNIPAPARTPLPSAPPAPSVASVPPASPAPSEPAPLASIPKPEGATLSLPLAPLAANWPESVQAEVAALDPATHVVLPADEVSAGLSKGRVSFSWKQIYSWLEPESNAPSAVGGDTVLQLPLKFVAPAFLAASKKPGAERKNVTLDESIPALFSDGRPPAEIPPPAATETAPPAAETVAEPVPVPETPAAAAESAPAPAPPKTPETVGELFHQPHKENWTPAELVTGIVTLPGVAGAIVALQEGLPVAASLPDGVKSEVVAAFLPQIFARLNQYAGEMRLGDVDDLLFTTHGAHCQIYRLGYIYFAVLGKAGEALPWHELHLITEELARQTHK